MTATCPSKNAFEPWRGAAILDTFAIRHALAGGNIRHEWHHPTKPSYHLTGEFIELDRPHRILQVECQFLSDPTPDNRIETTFTAKDGGALVVILMAQPDAATRNARLATGMTDGMSLSYDLLEGQLQPAPAQPA